MEKKKITQWYCNKCGTGFNADPIFVKVDKAKVLCPNCNHNILLTRKFRVSNDYVKGENGALVRKVPKNKLSKKERKAQRRLDN